MRFISTDAQVTKGDFSRYTSFCIGAGRAAEGLRKDFMEQLKFAKDTCGFTYIRFHGILHDDMDVYREDTDGNAVYNFQYIDILYDSILDIGMKPFVEFGFMPAPLASGDKTVFWWKGNITPPKNYEKWHDLIHALVLHWEERYGREELLTWFFEVWNEPNIPNFYTANQAEYFEKLYPVTVRAVKSVCEDYRVGGPATAGCQWVDDFVNHCKKNNIPFDFVSTHVYGVDAGALDEFGTRQLHLSSNKNYLIDQVMLAKNKIDACNYRSIPVHYTEWNSSYSSRDPIHDTYIQAAYMLHQLKNLDGIVDSFSYWTFTDIFEEAGPPPTPFHGGFGLLNLQGLPKPAYYVYRFLHNLGKIELQNDDAQSIICKNSNGIQILLWDYVMPETQESDQIYYKRDNPSQPSGPVKISITGLQSGKYKIELEKVGYAHGDVYHHYLQMGSPRTLTKAQIDELHIYAKPLNEKFIIEIQERTPFEYAFNMQSNDVVFIRVTPC